MSTVDRTETAFAKCIDGQMGRFVVRTRRMERQEGQSNWKANRQTKRQVETKFDSTRSVIQFGKTTQRLQPKAVEVIEE